MPKPQMIAGIVAGIALVVLIYYFGTNMDWFAAVETPAE